MPLGIEGIRSTVQTVLVYKNTPVQNLLIVSVFNKDILNAIIFFFWRGGHGQYSLIGIRHQVNRVNGIDPVIGTTCRLINIGDDGDFLSAGKGGIHLEFYVLPGECEIAMVLQQVIDPFSFFGQVGLIIIFPFYQ